MLAMVSQIAIVKSSVSIAPVNNGTLSAAKRSGLKTFIFSNTFSNSNDANTIPVISIGINVDIGKTFKSKNTKQL